MTLNDLERRNSPYSARHQGGAHGGRAPEEITGLFMFEKLKKTKWQPCVLEVSAA